MNNTATSTIEKQFNATFFVWKIKLPPDDCAGRRRGKILKAGWVIWYLFGSNEKGEYLDYYASHRMSGSDHVRLYLNGEQEELPVISEMRLCSEDPEEDKKLEARYKAENQEVERMLQEKGFGIQGDEPFAVILNRALEIGLAD